jgi:hypothetical protein
VYYLHKEQLQATLAAWGLTADGTVEEMRCRVKPYIAKKARMNTT